MKKAQQMITYAARNLELALQQIKRGDHDAEGPIANAMQALGAALAIVRDAKHGRQTGSENERSRKQNSASG